VTVAPVCPELKLMPKSWSHSRTIRSPHLSPTLNVLRKLDKPLIAGETGVQAANNSSCTSFAARTDAIKRKFDAYLGQAGVAGVMVWSWVPNARAGCSLESFPADPRMTMLRDYP
jgi:hypothetical protein